jgi:hypothetical protein
MRWIPHPWIISGDNLALLTDAATMVGLDGVLQGSREGYLVPPSVNQTDPIAEFIVTQKEGTIVSLPKGYSGPQETSRTIT